MVEWLALVPHSKKAFVWHLHVLSMPGDILVSSHCARTCSLHVPCFSRVSWFQRPAGDPELDFFFFFGRMIIFVSFCSYSLLPMPFFLFLFLYHKWVQSANQSTSHLQYELVI